MAALNMYTIKEVLIPAESGYETVDVHIGGGRINAIGTDLPPMGIVVEGQDRLLLPGFVNAHTHSSEAWQRCKIPQLPLELWLAELFEFPPLTPEQVYLSALYTASDTFRSGGTCIVDHFVMIPGQEIESVAATVKAYRETGIRAFVGPLLQDHPREFAMPGAREALKESPEIRSTEDTLLLLQEVIERFHRPEDGVYVMAAPAGPHFCTDALITGCIELSERYHLPRHTHLLETRGHQQVAYETYGCSAVERLHRLGFLGPQTSLAHCVWLEDSDIELLLSTGSTVVHNPLSNLRLGSGIAPILKYLQRGVTVSFGCDGAASNDAQDLLEAIKIGTILHNVTDDDYRTWITPRQAVEMAAQGGATGLKMGDQIGSLTVGKQADLVMYDLTHLSLMPAQDPIGLLVLGRPVNVVDSLWVRGRRLMADGHVLTIDEPDLLNLLIDSTYGHCELNSATRRQIETHYRQVMQLA